MCWTSLRVGSWRTLRIVWSLREPTMAEAGPLFERILETEQVARPSRDKAVWILLRHYLGEIASSSVAPRDGLVPMMNLYDRADITSQSRQYAGDSHGIEHLVGAHWSYEDIDDAARVVTFKGADEEFKSLDVEVVRRAQEWLARHGVLDGA